VSELECHKKAKDQTGLVKGIDLARQEGNENLGIGEQGSPISKKGAGTRINGDSGCSCGFLQKIRGNSEKKGEIKEEERLA